MNYVDKHNHIFLISSIHAFLASAPSLVVAPWGILDPSLLYPVFREDIAVSVLDPDEASHHFFLLLLGAVLAFSVGYYFIYKHGAKEQPLMVFVGGSGKIGVSLLLFRAYAKGIVHFPFLLLAAFPDLFLGLYFLYVWWFKLDGALSANPAGEVNPKLQ